MLVLEHMRNCYTNCVDNRSIRLSNFILLIGVCLNGIVNAVSNQEVENYLEMGKKLLAAGQLADALGQFHSAIDADPNNYMSYYRRGTVFLAMGRFKSALSDLSKVIELKPDFLAARLQRANVLTKQGLFDEAIKDYELIAKSDASNTEATTRLDKIFSMLSDLSTAKHYMANGDFSSAIELFTQILEQCPWSTEIHELRSECYLNIGEASKAILDIGVLAKLIPDNTNAYYRLSELHYSLGDADMALNNIRECLRLDPDHKKCSTFYKSLRKLTKLIESTRKAHDEQRYDECTAQADQLMQHDRKSAFFRNKGLSYMCSCHSKAKHVAEAVDTCTQLLAANNNNDADALYYRAQAYMADEQLDKALNDCQRANEIENSQRTHECIDRINKLIKQSKKRDYYKILGVKRSDDKAKIMKAYRKMAHKWHPDKFDEGPEKDKAQKVFIDIAAAKEVLTDPEKRAKYDNGEDPLDPEEQANQGGHGFNPFGHGFNPFQHGGGGGNGGNFQFKFKFN